jgi:hypothetical protein
MSRKIWQDVHTYYDLNGMGMMCCCPTNQYSQHTYFFDDPTPVGDVSGRVARRIIDTSYNKAVEAGFHPALYEATLVCTSDGHTPWIGPKQLVCAFLLDREQVMIGDAESDYDGPCLYVYLWNI